ncbi:nucleotidyltransferase domain-containing protein [Leptolyngbya sp. PCC 6406]|uniref:nucleotidyltransferase domain-containing protein n=1 Tax=Leptolyngbya sp. PCC 6406 TaxID=1173264 RepID=UPI0002AC51D6|nr:nucleotidyltransferase domain-containing protein [Leptolyngbya sp. PCC 6406]
MKHTRRNAILKSVKQYLQALYREQLKAVILYGSQAREDAHEFSDIDILVVLDAPINPYREIDRSSEFIAQICLDNDIVISRHFISSDKFKNANNPFLQNIRNEGIWICR